MNVILQLLNGETNPVVKPAARRRFSLSFLACLGVVTGLYLAAAVFINPRAYFRSRVFPALGLDSRTEKLTLFERFNAEHPVEGLVLGSSRAMLTAPEELATLTGKRFFNFCVDSARTEDYLATYRWARARGVRLGALLIALDVEAFHDDDQFDQRLARNAVLMSSLGADAHYGYWQDMLTSLATCKELLSRQYAQDMARSVRARYRPPKPIQTFDSNGLLHYLQFDQQVAAGTFRLDVRLAGSRDEYRRRFAGMSALSVKRKGLLETLLQEAKNDGVSVVIWITPLHPDLIRYLEQATGYRRLLEDLRACLHQLGKRYGIATLDMSEQSFYGGSSTAWYDGGHVNPSNAALITKGIASALNQHGP